VEIRRRRRQLRRTLPEGAAKLLRRRGTGWKGRGKAVPEGVVGGGGATWLISACCAVRRAAAAALTDAPPTLFSHFPDSSLALSSRCRQP